MTSLTVVKAGAMVTVQDPGRIGFAHAGVSAAGPMDPTAFALANALCGNEKGSAALEFAHIGGSYRVEKPARIAVTGGAADIRIDDRAICAWESHWLAPGATLSVGSLRGAVWGYIAFSGGIEVPRVLGSRATHLRTGLGGFGGRVLRNGDRLPLGQAAAGPLLGLATPLIRGSGPIRIVAGPQDDYFDNTTWRLFLSEPFRVTDRRDRMASVLDGPLLKAARGHDIVSDGTTPGAIQVPGSGRAIVLAADCQTTGGYPKIATVATVDLPRLLQMTSGTGFGFKRIGRDEAEELLIAQRAALAGALQTLARLPG